MSSIYDDSVLIQVPSGYGVGKLYSVIPNTPVGDFDVARSSWTTRRNTSGYIENVVANVPRLNYDSGVVCPYLLTEDAGTNLLTYPISFGNPYWIKIGSYIHSSTDYDGSAVSTEAMTLDDGIYNVIVRSTWTQVNDATTGNELCTKMVVDGTAAQTHYGRDGDASGFVSNGVGYSITADVYIPSSNSLVDGIGFGWHDYNSGTMPLISTTADGDTQISADTWTTITTKTIMADLSTAFDFSLALVDGTDNNFDGNSSDYACVKNVVITPLQPFEAPKVKPTLGSDLLSGWDFTSGWTAWLSATIDDNNSFTTTSNGSVYKSYLTVGTYYQIRIAGTTTTSALRLTNSAASVQYGSDISGTFDETIYFQAYADGALGLYHAGAGTSDITTLEVKEVTTCSWSGGGFETEAFKLVEGTNNGRHRCTTDNIVTSIGNAYTFPVYAKADTRTWIALEMYGVGDRMAWFDLANGVVGTKQANITSSEIVAMANGWYRCSITLDAPGAQGMFGVFLADADNSYSYTGDGTIRLIHCLRTA